MSDDAVSTRRAFLAVATAAGAGLAMTASVQAQTPAPPTSTASPTPKATPTPSPSAREFAQRMRKFDPQLTDDEIDSIAQQVDQLSDIRRQLRPKGRDIPNGDLPTPQFEVSE